MSVMCTYGMYGAVPRLEILQKDCENGFPNLPHTCREKKTVFIHLVHFPPYVKDSSC